LPRHEIEARARLTVLVRNLEQLEAVVAWSPALPVMRPAMVYGEFREPRLAKDAVARARQAGMAVGLATLRIVAPGDEGHLQELLDARPDALLVRNLASIGYAHEHVPSLPLVGDFSLNVANDLAAGLLAGELGLARLVPSLDLDWERLRTLLGLVRPDLVEIVIHQHVPMFHMQHCLFAANLSRGRDPRDCGRPCRRRVELRDRLGVQHPVVADAACRTTVFHAHAQSAAEYLGEMQRLGVSRFRIELLDETPDRARAVLDCYGRLLAGLAEPRAVLRELRALLPCGVTRGTFDRGRRV
jgi:putative protease